MKKHLLKYLFCLLTVMVLSIPSFAQISGPQTDAEVNELTIQTKTQTLVFHVELALSKKQQMQGLQMRDSLKENEGMLFMFKEPQTPTFWMKGTYIPLDMIFIDETGTIVGIHPKAVPLDKTPIFAPAPCTGVLEIGGGLAQKLGIANGDKVIHRFFKKDTK